MAYPRGHHFLPTYLSCYVLLATYTLRSTALSFDYNFSIPGVLDGAKLIYINDSCADGDRIILTNSTENRTGRVVHQQPVRLWDDRTGKRTSFTTSFYFAINSMATAGFNRGDGMAFFIGTQRLPSDSHGAFLGLFDNLDNSNLQQTVGVEFDTCRNEYDITRDPPDPVVDHIGIDINSITSKDNVIKGLPKLSLNGTMWADITYDADSTTMEVTLHLNSIDHPDPVLLKTRVDLKEAGLPQDAAVGFSAATGNLVESHELLSWSFHSKDGEVKTQLWVVLVLVAASALLVGLVAVLLCIIYRRMYRRPPPAPEIKIELSVAREFSYDELCRATENFSEDRKLGEGGFGKVYKGDLPDQLMPLVAVKRLKLQPDRPEATREEYKTEIMTLGQLRHRNLVKLVGWCDVDGSDLLLVYELIRNGSVHDHLHGSANPLTWPERYNIILGIGSAIDYLHNGNDKCVVHRDIKPNNVMLDESLEAKVCDFGLVRQVPHEQRSQQVTVAGCLPYMDPVHIANKTASPASDVYSFGVLLLEIATGTQPTVPAGDDRLPNTLINAVRESYKRKAVLKMADKRLNGEFDNDEMERVMIVGLKCVEMNRDDRPSIRVAIDLLSNLKHPAPEILV